MKSIDLRRQEVGLDELLRSVGGDTVRITSKDGAEFVLEAADAFDREADELGRSPTFLAFLAERSAEPGRTSLAELEARLEAEPVNPGSRPTAQPVPDDRSAGKAGSTPRQGHSAAGTEDNNG